MKKYVFGFILFMNVQSFATESTQWLYSEQPAKAVSLMIHGLNTKPSAMVPLAKVLNEKGVHVLNVALRGHRDNIEEFKDVTREQWLEDVQAAYKEARAVASKNNLPLYFVGFSLGALITEDLMALHPDVIFDKAVLLAPALFIRTRSKFIKIFNIFGDHFMVPSFSPEEVRANKKTSMAAYKALFNSVHAVEASSFKAANIPSLILMDPKDELVGYTGLTELKEKYALSHWTFLAISKHNPTMKGTYDHLIIQESAVGAATWDIMKSAIFRHLNLN